MMAICIATVLVSCITDPMPVDPASPGKDSCRIASIEQGPDTIMYLHWNEDHLLTNAFHKDFQRKDTTYYFYNSARRIIRSHGSDREQGVWFNYDNMGRVDSVTRIRFGFDTTYYEYEYELNNPKPVRMHLSSATGSGKKLMYEHEYEYNSSGDIVKMHETTPQYGKVMTTIFTHDNNPNCLRMLRTVDFGLNHLNATWFEEYTTPWNEHNILLIREEGPWAPPGGDDYYYGYFMNEHHLVDSIAVFTGNIRPVRLKYICE